MNAQSLLLTTAFRHRISEPNIEAGFERFRSVAVAACLREGLIREPIRLPEGALQCHWHLELTPAGVHAARRLLDQSAPPPHTFPQPEKAPEHRSSAPAPLVGWGEG